MLFPALADKRFGYLNLNDESRTWLERNGVKATDPNPLLDPKVSEQMVREAHEALGLDWSYGGWLENRRNKLRGAYMDVDETKHFLHLGVDFNVPAGTEIAADDLVQVLRVIPDAPEPGGWGTRVILQPVDSADVLVYGHLSARNLNCDAGDLIEAGEAFAEVGGMEENGGWFPHLHVQCIHGTYFHDELKHGEVEFDGYGHPDDRNRLARIYGDPMRHVSLR